MKASASSTCTIASEGLAINGNVLICQTGTQRFYKVLHAEALYPNAAGIDIGSASHYAAVPTDRDEQP
ncbi:hypothetical protein BGZ92_007275, partial [Podila epicladia]